MLGPYIIAGSLSTPRLIQDQPEQAMPRCRDAAMGLLLLLYPTENGYQKVLTPYQTLSSLVRESSHSSVSTVPHHTTLYGTTEK